MSYRLEITPAAVRGIASLPQDARRRLDACILALAENPHPPGSKKLTSLKGLYRVRVGDHRVVYSVEHGKLIVLVVRVGHRREIYRGL